MTEFDACAPLAFPALKAIGDFVTLRCALDRLSSDVATQALPEHHLSGLALRGSIPARIIDHGESVVPVMFDIQKHGPLRAAESALRRVLQRLAIPRGTCLVFDRFGPRERFLGSGHDAIALSESANFDEAYELFFGMHDEVCASESPRASSKEVATIPASRTEKKWIPADLVARCSTTVADCGLRGCRPESAFLRKRAVPTST